MGSPLVDQFRKGGVSRDVRLTAAGGLLPLKPIEQVELLFLLTRDRDRTADDDGMPVELRDDRLILPPHLFHDQDLKDNSLYDEVFLRVDRDASGQLLGVVQRRLVECQCDRRHVRA